MKRCKKTCFGIILPSGWVGRPYDALNDLDSYAWSENQVFITFNTSRSLKAYGPNLKCRVDRVGEQNEELVIYDFDDLEVLGVDKLIHFKSGVLTLVGYDMNLFP